MREVGQPYPTSWRKPCATVDDYDYFYDHRFTKICQRIRKPFWVKSRWRSAPARSSRANASVWGNLPRLAALFAPRGSAPFAGRPRSRFEASPGALLRRLEASSGGPCRSGGLPRGRGPGGDRGWTNIPMPPVRKEHARGTVLCEVWGRHRRALSGWVGGYARSRHCRKGIDFVGLTMPLAKGGRVGAWRARSGTAPFRGGSASPRASWPSVGRWHLC